MNLCGVTESSETPKALPMSHSTRPPPSPLVLSITPSEFQTPRSAKGDTLGVTATPSPALLNPLAHEFWSESSSARRAPILCPRLEPAQSSEPHIQRLQSGFRVKIHDGSEPKGRVVEIRLSQDRFVLHVVDDTMTEDTDSDTDSGYGEDEEKSPIDGPSDSQLLHNVHVEDIVRIDQSGDTFVSESFHDIESKKCFSIATKSPYNGCFHLDFECISMQQQEAIVTALRAVSTKGERSLRIRNRRASLPPFRGHSSTDVHAVSVNLSVAPDAVLSPMKRTCIYADTGSTEEGTELALNRAEGYESEGNEVCWRPRQSVPSGPFSFSEVSAQQSLDEQQDALEASSSMLAASFQEALDEWCSEDACLDLTEMSESLNGIFFLLETQQQGETNNEGVHGKHARADSADAHISNFCVTDFLDAPASIWADLPSPIAYDDKQSSSTHSSIKIRNRASVANAQASRWRQLGTEMRFESVTGSDAGFHTSIVTTKSLDDLDGTEERVASSQRVASGNFTDTSGYGLFELFPPGLWGEDAGPLLEKEDCCFYDSDPECSRMLTRRRAPRRIEAERLGKPNKGTATKPQRLNFVLPQQQKSKFEEEYASAIIDIMKSEQLPLLWHPTPTSVLPNRAPLCVSAWVERGTYLLTQTFVQPKFMWRPARQMDGESKQLDVTTGSLDRVDLLEIARVQESPNIDRQQFPFAKRRRSFIIETQSELHLFEAETELDKKRIVFGLKLTIARLASLIMIRDTRAVEEFFEPVAQVPGEAPAFAR